jgi:hypothetical protein
VSKNPTAEYDDHPCFLRGLAVLVTGCFAFPCDLSAVVRIDITVIVTGVGDKTNSLFGANSYWAFIRTLYAVRSDGRVPEYGPGVEHRAEVGRDGGDLELIRSDGSWTEMRVRLPQLV